MKFLTHLYLIPSRNRYLFAFLSLIGLFSMILIPDCSRASNSDDIDAHLRMADALRDKGDFEKAILEYRNILKEKPDIIEVRISLARLLSWTGKFKESIEEYRRVIEKQPDNIDVRMDMAEVLGWSKDFKNSIDEYQIVLQKRPDNTKARTGLARVLSWRGSHVEAIDEYKKVLNIDPSYVPAMVGMGEVYSWVGKYPESIKIFEEALKKESENIEAKKGLARVFSYQQEHKKSLSYYDDLLSKMPGDNQLRVEKARVLGWAKKYSDAEKEYKIASSQAKEPEKYNLEMKAKIANWNNWPNQAIHYYRSLIEIDPGNEEGRFDSGQIYNRFGMHSKAVDEYKKLLEIDPSHRMAIEALAKSRIMLRPEITGLYQYFWDSGSERKKNISKDKFQVSFEYPVSDLLTIQTGYSRWIFSPKDYKHIYMDGYYAEVSGYFRPYIEASILFEERDYSSPVNDSENYQAYMNFRITDPVLIKLLYARRDVTDNRDTMLNSIKYDVYSAGIEFFLHPRLSVSATSSYYDYSDKNFNRMLDLQTSYQILMQPTVLKLTARAGYQNFNKVDKAYWTPRDYWSGNIGVEWRHYLNRDNFWGTREIYYGFGYVSGYDSDDISSHAAKGELHIDITNRLSAHIDYLGYYSKTYDSRDLSFYINYRF